MALDIFFPEDIERICDALEQASLYHDQDIRIGWLAAMSAVRAAFGLPQKTAIPLWAESKYLEVEDVRR